MKRVKIWGSAKEKQRGRIMAGRTITSANSSSNIRSRVRGTMRLSRQTARMRTTCGARLRGTTALAESCTIITNLPKHRQTSARLANTPIKATAKAVSSSLQCRTLQEWSWRRRSRSSYARQTSWHRSHPLYSQRQTTRGKSKIFGSKQLIEALRLTRRPHSCLSKPRIINLWC